MKEREREEMREARSQMEVACSRQLLHSATFQFMGVHFGEAPCLCSVEKDYVCALWRKVVCALWRKAKYRWSAAAANG